MVSGGDAEAGTLFVVSTPIGNMGDFSFRAIETLRSVQLIVAEDTRHSRPLLDRHEIRTPVQAYHEHNEARATPQLVRRLESGESIALISDAGTPLLSDPGHRLVSAAAAAGLTVVPVPGASALLAALVGSGLAVDRFTFYGFLPRKGRERSETLEEIVQSRHTSVLYESPSRLTATLRDLIAAGAEARSAVVARELTKLHEEIRRGTPDALAAYYEGKPAKGEIVIVVAGRVDEAPDEAALRERARTLRAEGRSSRDIIAILTGEHGAPRNLAYRVAHED